MQFFLTHCHVAIEQHAGILLTLFLAGLFGGVTHCAGMCGPFVAAQVMPGEGGESYLKKLSGAALLPYHIGRLTTYSALGALAAGLSGQMKAPPPVAAFFLGAAGMIFLISALPSAKRPALLSHVPGSEAVGRIIGRVARPLMAQPTGIYGYALGILLGLLPCGLVIAGLMAVSATGNPVTGAFAMALFALGTVPSLFMVGLGSRAAYRKWPDMMRTATRGVMIFNGISLCILAGYAVF